MGSNLMKEGRDKIFACPSCGYHTFNVSKRDTINNHGPKAEPCPGSKKAGLLVGYLIDDNGGGCTACGEGAEYEDLQGAQYCDLHWPHVVEQAIAETRELPVVRRCPYCDSSKTQLVEAHNLAYILCTTCGASGPHCADRGDACARWDNLFMKHRS